MKNPIDEQPLLLPTHWNREQVLTVLDLLDALQTAIWEHYEDIVCPHFDAQLSLPFDGEDPFDDQEIPF